MTYTISLIFLLTILAYFFYKPIHKYCIVIYVISFIIALVFHEDANYITYGFTGLAFFIVVMYSGVFEKSVLRKRLFMVRADYAIIGSIFLFPHALSYLELLLEEVGIFNGTLYYYVGILSVATIIPLAITSFPKIRKQFNYKQWKKLHQLAYATYILIGLHLILINNERQMSYLIIFGSYFILKGSMLIHKKVTFKRGLDKSSIM